MAKNAKILYFQANAIGRSAKTVREFLEKHYSEEVSASEKESIKLALKALLEVVQSGSKNMEIAVMRRGEPLKVPLHFYSPHHVSRKNGISEHLSIFFRYKTFNYCGAIH